MEQVKEARARLGSVGGIDGGGRRRRCDTTLGGRWVQAERLVFALPEVVRLDDPDILV